MKTKIKLAVLALGLTTIFSCSRYIAPPFTDVSKVSQVKAGMKIKQVSDILGIDPYDVFYMQETGAQVLSFNYRLKNRIMYVYNTVNRTEVSRRTSDENSQKDGEVFYDKNYRTLYAMFNKDGDLTSYITTSGENDKGKLIVTANTIKYYDEKNTTLVDSTYNKAFNPYYNNRPILIGVGQDGRFFGENGGSNSSSPRWKLFRRK
jgi:hypothetical protein